MKKLVFMVTGAAALALAACSGGNEDQVNNAEMNQMGAEELNGLANEAANTAEADALANQQAQLDENAAAEDNTVNPADADEQNVSGM